MKFLIVLLVIAILVGFPAAFIWSLNTLFELEIEYTWKTWLAAMFLGSLFAGRMTRS